MNSEQRYRSTLGGMTPSPAWQKETLEAMQAAQTRRKRPSLRRPLTFAAAAAVLVLGITGGVWWSSRMEPDPAGPGVAQTPEPAVTPTPTTQPSAGWGESFLLVADLAQQLGSNPTAGHTYELTQLPVYTNPLPTERDQRAAIQRWAAELGYTISGPDSYTWRTSSGESTMGRDPVLEATCTDGTRLQLTGLSTLAIYDAPDLSAVAESVKLILLRNGASDTTGTPELAEESLTTYNFDGEAQTTQVTFLTTPDASVADRLYSYSFWRMELTQSQLTIYLPPADSGTVYPLRSPDDAQAAFRAGDYWGGCTTAYPDQAQILFVCLEYDITPGQPYLQPVYRILYTQSYWDELVADWVFDGVDPSPYMGLGIAYVPAIAPEYQDEVPYQRYFNDGLAHHTPEDLP